MTHLLSAMMNRVSLPKPTDPVIPTSLSHVPTRDLEVEPMTVKEMKSKLGRLENQIKQMKESHSKYIRFSDKYVYPDFGYPPKFRVPYFENIMGMVVRGSTFICTE